MEYIIKNKKTGTVEHYCTSEDKIPENAIVLGKPWTGVCGEPNDFYGDDGIRLSEEELLDKNLIEDDRGVYYNENHQAYEVKDIKAKINLKGWSKEKPSHITDKLVKGAWVKDKKQRKAYDDNLVIGESLQYLASTDWYVLRKMDSGKEIPSKIFKKREEARVVISEKRKDSEENIALKVKE